jgi:hypothetical protein
MIESANPRDLINPYSKTRKEIDNLRRDLQLVYKNEDFAKLGVLAGPDMAILEQIIENPASVSNLISGKEGVAQRLRSVADRAETGFQTKAQSFGLIPAMQGAGAAERIAPKQSSKIRVSNGKETLLIDASDLKDALADGYREVK